MKSGIKPEWKRKKSLLTSNQRHIEERCLSYRAYKMKTGHADKWEQHCVGPLLLNLLWFSAVGSSNGDNSNNSKVLRCCVPEEAFSFSDSACSLLCSGNHHTYKNHSLVKLGALILGVKYQSKWGCVWRTREGIWGVVVTVLGAAEAHRKSDLRKYRAATLTLHYTGSCVIW